MSACIRFVGIATVVALGCASNRPRQRLPPPTEATGEAVAEDVVPPEKLEEIQLILQRKQQDVAHCWTDEAERTHNRNLVIDVMFKLTIEREGRANDVQIMKNSMPSKEFESCLVTMVRGFDFPAIPSAQEMTWEYRFKPLY